MSVTVVRQDVVVRPLENAIQLNVVAGQGPSGTTGGTTGPFAISTPFKAVPTGTLNLTPYWEKAGTIGTYRRLKATNGGSFTLSVLLNGVAIPGWDSLSVTGTAQSPTCDVELAAGDRLDWVFADVTGTPGMEGSIAGVWV